MKKKWMVMTAAATMAVTAQAQAQSVTLQKPVPYAEDNDISDSIKSECSIGEQLADFIKQYSSVPVELVAAAPDTGSGRVLTLEITDAVSMGNAFIGHQKFTKVRGSLYEGGEKVASFRARRNSMGGAFAGFKGSCSVLGRTVKVIGRDIAEWLAAPRDGANLGD
ncbi:hypothetical protein EBB59_06510 [Lysobacter pythonis]|uniref:DUF4410 domain-containing protein n=1 Tax=Solilutibacter pythonis TaxID=2483112 RepID=A0A3M2I4M9_9GAMM|nr:hypothetical protein [Lysobacter pythonis]RMH93184.1 hypothetical protein EBB59_06510 [Lysobacter pythonis]